MTTDEALHRARTTFTPDLLTWRVLPNNCPVCLRHNWEHDIDQLNICRWIMLAVKNTLRCTPHEAAERAIIIWEVYERTYRGSNSRRVQNRPPGDRHVHHP